MNARPVLVPFLRTTVTMRQHFPNGLVTSRNTESTAVRPTPSDGGDSHRAAFPLYLPPMPGLRISLLISLMLFGVLFGIVWVRDLGKRRRQASQEKEPIAPSAAHIAIGFVSNFLDTLGIDRTRAALGLAVGGVPGVILASYVVKHLPVHFPLWLVVVTYSALALILSAKNESESNQP